MGNIAALVASSIRFPNSLVCLKYLIRSSLAGLASNSIPFWQNALAKWLGEQAMHVVVNGHRLSHI